MALICLQISSGGAVLPAHSSGMLVDANHDQAEPGDAQGYLK